jgi:hypothetical protein
MMSPKTAIPMMIPTFLTVDDDMDEPPEPPRSVEALERVTLGVEVELFVPYTYEVIFALSDVGFTHFTETEETKAWNWFPAAL